MKASPARRPAVEIWSAEFRALRLAVPLFLGGLVQALVWLAIACFALASSTAGDGAGNGAGDPHTHPPNPHPHPHAASSIAAGVIASVWAYIPLRVAFSPSIRVHARPPPDILILLLTLGIAAAVDGAGRAFETYVYGRPWVQLWVVGWWLVDMGVVCTLIWVILVTPLELPSERVNAKEIVSGFCSFQPALGTHSAHSIEHCLGSCGQSGRLREYMGVDVVLIRHSAHQAGAFPPRDLPISFLQPNTTQIEYGFPGHAQHVERGRCLGGFSTPPCGSVAGTLHDCQGQNTPAQIMDRQFAGPDVRHCLSIPGSHAVCTSLLKCPCSPLQNGCSLNACGSPVQLRRTLFP